MEHRLERLESKLDKLIDHQSNQNSTLERLTVSVETHERRSTNLENIVLPMKRKFDKLEGALQLVGAIATAIGVAAAAVKIIEFFNK